MKTPDDQIKTLRYLQEGSSDLVRRNISKFKMTVALKAMWVILSLRN